MAHVSELGTLQRPATIVPAITDSFAVLVAE
jgi:hypothetical protein